MAQPAEKIDLAPGDPLQLQFAPDEGRPRLQVQVIGLLTGGSVLVTAPTEHNSLVLLRDGQGFVARSFLRKRVLAFPCRVLRSCMQPYAYLHLSYPEHLEKVVVRGARRVATSLAASVRQELTGGSWSEAAAATLSDLSTSGALLQTALALNSGQGRVRIGTSLPMEQMEEQTVAVDGVVTVAYADTAADGRRYGIRFTDIDAASKLALRAYVYENLLGDDR
ncbi:MAG: flagellar brake protein [Nevskia sp.]|nr:flagellar brake protein [Nevskia sp.]